MPVSLRPVKILSLQMEWVLLVVPKDLEHNGLALDVFDEGLGHLYRNLNEKWGEYGSYL